jgi:hypothetical protein
MQNRTSLKIGSNSIVHVFSLDSSRPTCVGRSNARPSLAENNAGNRVAIKQSGKERSDLWPEREQVPAPLHRPPPVAREVGGCCDVFVFRVTDTRELVPSLIQGDSVSHEATREDGSDLHTGKSGRLLTHSYAPRLN